MPLIMKLKALLYQHKNLGYYYSFKFILSFLFQIYFILLFSEILPKILKTYYFKYDIMEEPIEDMSNEELNSMLEYVSSHENEDYPLEIDFKQ